MKFIFVHIPKTAGETFGRILEKNFDGVIRDTGDPNDTTNYEDYPIIWGHFHADKYEHLGRPLITFVRDPVERLISDYHFFHYAYEDLNVRGHAAVRRNKLTQYIQDINKFSFIGIQERFEESLDRFEQWCGRKISRDYVNSHVNTDKKPVSQEDRQYIRDLHEKDYKIYREGLRRFRCQ